ncbi:MAG: PEP-CTERM sorting domain-containing protein [Halioglobus sp.]|nr:PEP-CTERM sorting domain-containing protein [Halioglobus sp.]
MANMGTLSLGLVSPSGALGASFDELVTCNGTNDSGCTNSTPMLANVGDMLVPGDLTPYVGNGTFNISSTLASLVSVSTNPDNGSDYIDNATTFGLLESAFFDGTVTVKFTNDSSAVPEPGVLSLLASGLLGLSILHRRRRLRV